MAAAAIRVAARKICGRAFDRPQSFYTTVASAAVREEQRRLLPWISHGRSSLRRFISSESPSFANNNKHLATNTNADQSVSLTTRIDEKKQELLHLLREADHSKFAMELENKKLLHLLGRTPGPAPGSTYDFINKNLFPLTIVGALGIVSVIYVEIEYMLPLLDRMEQYFSSAKPE